jgi:hypothetical protein
VDCSSDEEGDGDGNEGGGQATVMATATKRMMAMGTMVAGDEEGNGDGGKSNGNRVAGEQIDIALINFRIFFHMMYFCKPKWLKPIYRCGGGI